MDLDRQIGREIDTINRVLHNHGIDAGTLPDWTVIAGGSFVVYALRLGQRQRLNTIADRLPELSEALSALRGAPCPVRLRLMPAALEVGHPAPYPLSWQRADLAGLRPGQMLAGRSYSAAGSQQEVIDLTRSPHILLAGITQSGKSTLEKMLALSLACATPPGDLDLYVIDLKNEDMVPLRRLPHIAGLAVDRAAAAALVRRLHELKDRRVAGGRDNWRRAVLVIDELAELAAVPGILDLLGSVVSVGASKRINVVAATQKPLAGVVGSIAKAQFTTRLAGSVADATEAATATGRRDSGAHLLPGRGAFLRVEGPDLIRLQSYLLDDEGVEHLIGQARAAVGLPACTPAMHRAHPAPAPTRAAYQPPAPAAAPAATIPPALAAVFAVRFDGAGGLRRPGMAEALRVLYGDAAPTAGRNYQNACAEVLHLLGEWRGQSGAAPAAIAPLATIHKLPGRAAGAG